MKKKAPRPLDFKKQTPDIQIPPPEFDLLYKKAFLTDTDKEDSEYSKNTSPWD